MGITYSSNKLITTLYKYALVKIKSNYDYTVQYLGIE